MSIFCQLCWCLCLTGTLSFYMPKIKHYPYIGDAGDEFNFSPLVYINDTKTAQKLCSVNLVANHYSCSGLFSVKETLWYKTNQFFWFFPVEKGNITQVPVILWIQGGTGVSCFMGVFEGYGPYYIDPVDESVHLRENRLTKEFSVLYVDATPGAGYSYTTDEIGYPYKKREAATYLIRTLRQFFLLFPNLQQNKVYIYGESYAASYVPPLVQMIHHYNWKFNPACPPIYITGAIMTNTFFNPLHIISKYNSTLVDTNLIGLEDVAEFQNFTDKIHLLMEKQNTVKAFKVFDKMIIGGMTRYPTLFQNKTKCSNYYNYEVPNEVDQKYHDAIAKLVQSEKFRRAVHVGNLTFNVNYTNILQYMKDILLPHEPSINRLLKYGYRVCLLNGQLDTLVPYSAISDFTKTISWIKRLKFNTTKRSNFFHENKLEGYFKRYGSLMEIMLFSSGHVASKNTPNIVLDVIRRFINKKIF